MKFRIAEVSIDSSAGDRTEAWWPVEGEWEGDTAEEAVQGWADETDAAGQGVYLVIPVDVIEAVDVEVSRVFATSRRVRATTG